MTLPTDGINGEGRPTRVEILAGSKIKMTGDVIESAYPEVAAIGPLSLLVYPAGPVTLSLPVALPPGNKWISEQVSITYEACSKLSCMRPVIGKLVPLRVPSAGLLKLSPPSN
jgi:hypothetical protein